MDKVKRFALGECICYEKEHTDICPMVETEKGEYVLYADYKELADENEKLRQALKELGY